MMENTVLVYTVIKVMVVCSGGSEVGIDGNSVAITVLVCTVIVVGVADVVVVLVVVLLVGLLWS